MKRAVRTGERRYAGLLLHERRADRRARLAAAGLELYGTTGYDATTIPMLCSAAGVTSRHFYEEYGSRETLLRQVYDTIWHASSTGRGRSGPFDHWRRAHPRGQSAYFAT